MASCFAMAFLESQQVPPGDPAANGAAVVAASSDGGVRVQSSSHTAGGDSGAVLHMGAQTATTADDATVMPFHDSVHGRDGAIVFARVGPARDADGLFCIVRHEDGSWTVGGVPEPADPAAWPGADFAAAVDRACAATAAAPPHSNTHSATFPGGEIQAEWTGEPGAVDWGAVVARMLAHCEAAGGWFCV